MVCRPGHENDPLERLRHSAAHIMASAVQELFPGTKVTIGPVIEDGFFYDFDTPRGFTPEDLIKIEERMGEIAKKNVSFIRRVLSRNEAIRFFQEKGENYKVEIIQGLSPNEEITLYEHGDWVDLCRGPHLDRTGQLKHFKLLSVAGAYWRGDEAKPMLQRIYGTAFETAEALGEFLHHREEAEKRDHRRLGRELELFFMDPMAPGSPFFLPKGATLYNQLIQFMRDQYAKRGYQEVLTPQVFSTELWQRSGHYQTYRENMFPFMEIEKREFGVKPMNCPGHALLYASKIHSYRELPIRYADFARLHRYERSGVLHGLTRVRSFSQDDAHIFCRPEQIESETIALMEMIFETYRRFHFEEIQIHLSLRPEKRIGSDAIWDQAEMALRSVLKKQKIEAVESPGEGAFYGPKVDFIVRDAMKREWQLGTIQLDFSLPERFDLKYVSEEGKHLRPVVIHRAILGSLERFLGILVEHYAGAFPVWLAPVQTTVIPITTEEEEYAQAVGQRLREAGLRVEQDLRNEKLGAKIREAQLKKIPYMLVVGKREKEEKKVSVRSRSRGDLGGRGLDEFIREVEQEIKGGG